MMMAKRESCNAVIFMADADTKVLKEWKSKCLEIQRGFNEAEKAKPEPAVSGIACVPKSASESWLLSDTSSWRMLGLNDVNLLPNDPENIWGKRRNDPAAEHPHQYFERICRAASISDDGETRWNLARNTNIDTLRKKCPNSFDAFYISITVL
ncbi:MAG: DUF4276 family protein [Gammaproteobacteria bacterium]|nr:DUF4276 family protein [Gammaproteobacteria bacterium]